MKSSHLAIRTNSTGCPCRWWFDAAHGQHARFGEVQRLARLAVKTWDLALSKENARRCRRERLEPEIQAAEGEEQASCQEVMSPASVPGRRQRALDIYRRWGAPVHRDGDIIPARARRRRRLRDLLPPDAWPWSASVGRRVGVDNLTPCSMCRSISSSSGKRRRLPRIPVWSEALTSDVPDAGMGKNAGLW